MKTRVRLDPFNGCYYVEVLEKSWYNVPLWKYILVTPDKSRAIQVAKDYSSNKFIVAEFS